MRPLFSAWMFFLYTGLLLSTMLLSQTAPAKPPASPPPQKVQETGLPASLPQFEDVAAKAGLTVAHISSPDKKYIVESMSGGVGLIDCDNDGKLDIITVNGSTVERYRQGGDPMITLYHQDADSTVNAVKFTDIPKLQASPARVGAWAWRLRIMTTTGCKIFMSRDTAATHFTTTWATASSKM